MEFQSQVKSCLICDKKLMKHTHPETKSAANLFATILTKVFSFEPRFYHGELATGGGIRVSSDSPINLMSNSQNKIEMLKIELMKIAYCYECVRNIRSINEILKKIERLEQKVIDYKFEIANQFIEFTTNNQQHNDLNADKAFTAINDSQNQKEVQSQHQQELKDEKFNIISDDDHLQLVRTEAIEGFNFLDFRESYANSRPALIKTEEPSLSLSQNTESQVETVLPSSNKDLRVSLTRLEEIPELFKYITKPKIEEGEVIKLKLIDPVTKQEVQKFEIGLELEMENSSENLGGNEDPWHLEESFPNSPDTAFDEDADYFPSTISGNENSESEGSPGNSMPSEILQTIMHVKEDRDVQIQIQDEEPSIAENKVISCEFCSAEFPTYSGLSQHKRKTHGSNLRMCIKCGEEFSTDNELRIHRSNHRDQLLKPLKIGEVYRCPSQNCKFISKTKQNVFSHIRRKHRFLSKPVTCEMCSAEFQTLAGLVTHKSIKHGTRGNMCTKCGKSFGTEPELKKHRKIHLTGKGTRSFPCTKCSYVGKTRDKLTRHLETHDPQGNYICQYCGLGFRSSQLLKYHQGSKHLDLNLQDPDLYKCKICGKVSASPPILRNHMKEIHFPEQCKYFCDTCGRGFLTIAKFNKHQVSHTDERNYECKVCHAKFKYQSHLISHSQRHTGQFRFNCKTCGKFFTSSNSYKRHSQIHAGVLKYFCTICGKGFPVNNYLYSHMRSHETEEERKQRLEKAKDNKEAIPVLNKLYHELRVANKISAAVPFDPNIPAVEEYPMIYDYTRDRTDLRQKREAEALREVKTEGRKKGKAKTKTARVNGRTAKEKLELKGEESEDVNLNNLDDNDCLT